MNDIKTFVLLKYEIITSDKDTWQRCEKYPESVRSNWAWRCAEDVEYLAKGYKEAENKIAKAILYRNGLISLKDFDFESNNRSRVKTIKDMNADSVAKAFYFAASDNLQHDKFPYSASLAVKAYSSCYFSIHTGDLEQDKEKEEEKWNLYIDWLIEELCEYESKQGEVNE